MKSIIWIFAIAVFGLGTFTAFTLTGNENAATESAGNGTAVTPGLYELDAAHSEIGFRVKHLGISTVKGSFGEGTAVINFPTTELKDLKAEASVRTASINTNNKDRDDHLRSADFFDAEKNPTITFVSRQVSPAADGKFTLKGDLTMRGVTKPVVLEAEYLGTAADPWGNQKVGFTAEGTINRKVFGLNWNKALEAGGVLVGEDVTIVLDVQATKK